MSDEIPTPNIDATICLLCGKPMAFTGYSHVDPSTGMPVEVFECPHCEDLFHRNDEQPDGPTAEVKP